MKFLKRFHEVVGAKVNPHSYRPRVEELEARRLLSTVAAGPNGEVFATFGPNRQLWELDSSGWHFLDSNVAAVSVGADGTVDVVFTDSSLWQLDDVGWHELDFGANTVAAGPN